MSFSSRVKEELSRQISPARHCIGLIEEEYYIQEELDL